MAKIEILDITTEKTPEKMERSLRNKDGKSG